MAIRTSGMVSGMDTDSIIKELMTAKSIKKTRLEQQKTKLEWKQEKWADLNTKLYKLYTDQLSKVRLEGNYSTKKVNSGNENIVTATATSAAGSGTHMIEVKNLASPQFITGAPLETKGTKSTDKLSGLGVTAGTIIRVTTGSGATAAVKNLEVTENTTVADFVNVMKEAGLNASFDESQGRFIINSKKTGQEGVFNIATYSANSGVASTLIDKASKLKEAAGLTDAQVSAYRVSVEDLSVKQAAYDKTKDVTSWTKLQEAKKKVADIEESFYKQKAGQNVIKERLAELKAAAEAEGTPANKDYKEIETAVQRSYYKLDADGKVMLPLEFTPAVISNVKKTLMQEATAIINQKMKDGEKVYNDPDPAKNEKARNDDIEIEYKKLYETYGATETEGLSKKATEIYQKSLNTALTNAANAYISTEAGAGRVTTEATKLKGESGEESISETLSGYKTALAAYTASPVDLKEGILKGLGLADMKVDVSADGKTTTVTPVAGAPSGFILKDATDAKVNLDGADMTVSGNTLTVGGVTYNLKGAQAGTTISVNVTNDSQAVYDMVKNFVKGYNEILGELNKIYNATSSKGYEPLTKDEMESMSDKQVEMWEGKIKDSLLRRDDTLDSVVNTLRSSLQGGITVGGKNYSLASFGIVTGAYTEKGLLHIEGDKEDGIYSAKTNKLMNALADNPEAVATALSGIFTKLYTGMQDKMATSSISSALTFYNDKEMKTQVTKYTKDIKTWETRLKEMENRYYKQYTAMEKTLSKLQSSSNSLASMLGK